MLANDLGHAARLRGARVGAIIRGRRQQGPEPGVASRHEGDRRRPRVTGEAPRPISSARLRAARPQAHPGDAPRQAQIIEPGRIIAGQPRRQDFAFPGAFGLRCPEALELTDDGGERVRPLHPRLRGHPLPGKQKAQEVARRDRLDLGAKALDRVPVNAGEQPAFAPFVDACVRGEAAAQREALGFKRGERRGDVELPRKPERGRQSLDLGRAQTFQAAADDLDQREIRRPGAFGT